MTRTFALILAALCTACASAPQRVACRGVAISAPAPAGPFPAYVAAPTRKDVLVFVHGLGGDAVKSWTNRNGVYWPRVASNDLELADYDVYVYAYETSPTGQCLGIPDLATQMRTRLISDRVFETHDRVIFVSHSLGGLVVREMLTTFDELTPQTPLLFFYGTPGHGAELATWASLITRCQQVKDVRPEHLNSYLRSLNNTWKHRMSDRIRSRCATEGFTTRGVGRLVKPATGEALCDDISLSIPGDHFGIVKVDCERDDPHVFLKTVLSEGQPARLAVSPSGLSVRRITDLGDVSAVAVAPDAKTVFVSRSGSAVGIYATDVNGASPRKLFEHFGDSIACGSSNCYFDGWINERPGVYRFTSDKAPELLFSGRVDDIHVSPAGDHLLFRRSDDRTPNDIVVRRIDGDSQTVELSSPSLHNASWHPDGKSILYVESSKAAVLHDLATGKQTRLPRPAMWIADAAWETRGKYVLVYAQGTPNEFWVARPDGESIGPILRDKIWYDDLRTTPLPDTFSAVRRETRMLSQLGSLERPSEELRIGRMNIVGPFSWTSPETLLYTAIDEQGSRIEEYNIYAQQERRVSPTAFFGRPTITPDGAHIVFSGSAERPQEIELWMSAADKWDPVKLAALPTTFHTISRDSRWVAFVAFGPHAGLYVTSLDATSQPRRLTGGYIHGASFAGPQLVIFHRASGGRRPLCKVDREAGPESCFTLDDVQGFAVSPDGKTVVALTPSIWDSGEYKTPLHFIDIASGAIKKKALVPRWVGVGAGITWTADGSRIVYATQWSSSTNAVESYRIADGAHEIVSKPSEGEIRDIAVSPDSRYALFSRSLSSSDAVLLTVTR